MEYKKQGHAIYHVRYHVIISTKYRRKVLKGGMGEYLKKKIYQIGRFVPEVEIYEVNTDKDHMHILMSVPPKIAVSEIVKKIKANTGRVMRARFPFLDKVYWGTEGIWSIGYFVSTVGVNEEIVRRYIERQGKEDCGQAKLEF